MSDRAVLDSPATNRAPAKSTALVTLNITVNGRARRVRVPPMKRLLDVLRQDCALPGTKEGCGEGECGACSVLLEGRTVCSCLIPAVQADGARVVTVEGLARGPKLSALQQAFLELGGAQCGICTPGMLITSMELLGRCAGRVPSEDEVREALAGNLCRCTGYQKIVDAVRQAAGGTGGRQPSQKAAPRAVRRPAAKAGRNTKQGAAARSSASSGRARTKRTRGARARKVRS